MFPYQELRSALESDIAGAGYETLGCPISSDMSVQEVRCQLLHGSFFKKLEPIGGNAKADELALEKFKAINSAISTSPFEFSVESEQDSVFWDYFRDNFLKTLTPGDVSFDLEFIRETFAVGPGSSLLCDNESFYTKLFASRITYTDPYLLALYRAAIIDSDSWSEAERQRSERFGERVVSGNRLFFVPKTAEISRTCCTEPLVNMMLQKAIGAFLEKCLGRSFGISLEFQPDFNRELARIGSLDGSFGTIDLQSASDSISWSLVQRICPSNLLGYFRLARCERTVLPDGTESDLNMISTMGNGFTFPLQTIIFASAVRAVYQMMNLDSHCPKTQFGVFGDDIIVKREAYAFLIRGLTKLGFKVNDSKSFNTGSFRESCGHDWYAGHYVRGVYIRSLETVSDVYSAINRLNRWSALAGVRLQNTILALRKVLKRELLVPPSESDDSGIQVPFDLTVPRLDNNYWFTFRKSINVAKKRRVPKDLEDSVQLNYTHYNEYGWAVTFLGGFARSEDRHYKSSIPLDQDPSELTSPSAFMTLRNVDGARRTKVVRDSIPFWDWAGPTGTYAGSNDPARSFSFGVWKNAVTANR